MSSLPSSSPELGGSTSQPFESGEVLDGFRSAYERLGYSAAQGFEAAAHVLAVAELLIAKGVIGLDELDQRRRAIKDRLQRAYVEAGPTVQVSTEVADKYAIGVATVEIDCQARLSLCQAACCRLRFALSEQDIEEGLINWTLSEPYLNRQRADGYCIHCDDHTMACKVYQARPAVCRRYDCRNDSRIWVDFERRIPNPDLLRDAEKPKPATPVAPATS